MIPGLGRDVRSWSNLPSNAVLTIQFWASWFWTISRSSVENVDFIVTNDHTSNAGPTDRKKLVNASPWKAWSITACKMQWQRSGSSHGHGLICVSDMQKCRWFLPSKLLVPEKKKNPSGLLVRGPQSAQHGPLSNKAALFLLQRI